MIVDGIEGKAYERIGSTIVFSPDSKHVAYIAQSAGKKFVVVMDGREEKPYDNIGNGSLLFSPDSTHLAYGAQSGDKRFVVLDGKELKRYVGVGSRTLIFSPDSKNFAYIAQTEKKQIVVVNGKEIDKYDAIVALEKGAFIFDRSDILRFLAFKDQSIYMVEAKIN
jgi:hypothetical protein